MMKSDDIDPVLVKLFVGYGGDVTGENGTVFKAEDQQKLKMNFLKIVRGVYGDGTLSDCMVWFQVSSEGALGREVTMTGLALDLNLPISTVSHCVSKMVAEGRLERYSKQEDRRRVYIRVTREKIEEYREDADDVYEIWVSQRQIMKGIVSSFERREKNKELENKNQELQVS